MCETKHSALRKIRLGQASVDQGEGVGGSMSEDLSLRPVQVRPRLEFELNQPSARRKLSLGARISALIPYVIASLVWVAAAYAASVIAWFAILITGQYPSGLFAFNARAWRFLVTTNSYALLLVDVRPPLSGRQDPAYPLQADVTPLPEYNRLLTLFRFPLLIPLYIVTILALIAAFVAFLPSLFTITVFRRQPPPLQAIIALAMRLDARFISSAFLLTEILWVTDQR
jgi:hypothetical protein